MNDPALGKKESIERCVKRIRAYYAMKSEIPFDEDYLKQDAIAANLQRLCELCIDFANMAVRKGKLGIPRESRESFAILRRERIIPEVMAQHLIAMVGFRNTLVHQYQDVDMSVMADVIENHLEELVDFTVIIMDYLG
ncbi:MAG: DUF86 domain-containing protein [Nitrospirae bacterium]|nr:DUF86 domain-containing protein [Nitrospirota bacterium]